MEKAEGGIALNSGEKANLRLLKRPRPYIHRL